MAAFAIFEHPGKDPDKTIFVKEGFSTGAFVFTALWALWHRLWVMAAILAAAYSALLFSQTYLGLNESVATVLHFGMSVLLGFVAQDLRSAALRRSGYAEVALIIATNREEAELKYTFATPVTAVSMTSPPFRSMTAAADPLGLFGNA